MTKALKGENRKTNIEIFKLYGQFLINPAREWWNIIKSLVNIATLLKKKIFVYKKT